MTRPVRFHNRVRLSLTSRLFSYCVMLGVWASGAGWLVYHYFLNTRGLFGPSENPITHWWIVAHGLFAFLGLFLFGLIWDRHIAGAWHTGRHRVSGIAIAAVFFMLCGTGYLLYYAGGDDVRTPVSLIHWIVGLAAIAPFALHRFAKGNRR